MTPTWFEHAAFWSGVRRATVAPRSHRYKVEIFSNATDLGPTRDGHRRRKTMMKTPFGNVFEYNLGSFLGALFWTEIRGRWTKKHTQKKLSLVYTSNNETSPSASPAGLENNWFVLDKHKVQVALICIDLPNPLVTYQLGCLAAFCNPASGRLSLGMGWAWDSWCFVKHVDSVSALRLASTWWNGRSPISPGCLTRVEPEQAGNRAFKRPRVIQ